jgi:hypothetical protein
MRGDIPEAQTHRFWFGFCAGAVTAGWIVGLGAALFQRGGMVDPGGFFAAAALTLLVLCMFVPSLFGIGLSKLAPPEKAKE